jgi:hypothetical protein
MRVFYILFYPPLIALNWASNLILRAIGIDVASPSDLAYSQEELRIILSKSQKKGAFSFNRLLFFENLIDMGSTKVEHAMVPLNRAKVLVEDAPWEENLETIRQSKFSRYPLVKAGGMEILGIVHVKDIVLNPDIQSSHDGLRKVVRPALKVPYTQSLETTLEELQKGSSHMAVVTDSTIVFSPHLEEVSYKPLEDFSFICADLKDISLYCQVSNYAYKIMKRLLPGAYTFILKATKLVPKIAQTKQKTVGIRIPDNKICLALVRELGHPIISSSVYKPNEGLYNDSAEIEERFGKQLDL